MPRIKSGKRSQAKETTWEQTIVERIRGGKVVPLVSNAIGNDLVLGGHQNLLQSYAEYAEYPLTDGATLSDMSQYRSLVNEGISDALALKEDYINFVKNRLFDIAEGDEVDGEVLEEAEEQFDELTFSQFCEHLGYPQFPDEELRPFLHLATFDLPVFVTTSYHGFLEMALRKAGKQPRTEISRWHMALEQIPSVLDGDYQPSRQEPLVYHLHGYDEYPDSLVLTEDDHLKFLVASAQSVGRETDPIHKRVRHAMSDSSLMILGYRLRNWDFRSLFWSLIAARTRSLTSVLAIQLEPSEDEKIYMQKYLGVYDFRVFWGDLEVFTTEMHSGLIG